MAISRGYSFAATEQVTNAKLHTLVDSATITAIVNNDIDAAAAIEESKISFSGTTVCKLADTQTVTGNKTFTTLTKIHNLIGSLMSYPSARIGTVTSNLLVASLASINSMRLTSLTIGDTITALSNLGSLASLSNSVPTEYKVKTYVDGKTNSISVLSNVIFEWYGFDGAINNTVVLLSNAVDLTTAVVSSGVLNQYFGAIGTTNRVILRGKYKHLAGITTVSIYARLWANSTAADSEAVLTGAIGGQSNTVKSVTSATPAWVTSSNITVSTLTAGTVYDITISIKGEGASDTAYCSAVVLIAS